ncbi:MAG: hypothetical protein R3C53_13745 [Pirellulaceae bacterium]
MTAVPVASFWTGAFLATARLVDATFFTAFLTVFTGGDFLAADLTTDVLAACFLTAFFLETAFLAEADLVTATAAFAEVFAARLAGLAAVAARTDFLVVFFLGLKELAQST